MKVFKGVGIFFLLAALFSGGYLWNTLRKVESIDPLVWESEIQKFRNDDLERRPTSKPMVLVGSSSIALYSELEKLMQPIPIVKRGFGGASVSDVSYYRKEIIDKYKPSKILIYVGAIDIYFHHEGNPNLVVSSIADLFTDIQNNNPSSDIYYIAIRPSPFQSDPWQDIDFVNEAIKKIAGISGKIYFINANNVVRGSDGRLLENIYKFDKMHLNEEGNELWWGEIKRQLLSQS